MFTVIYYKKTWYLCELETEKDKHERLNLDDKTKKFTYWGHKFETYVTSGTFRRFYILNHLILLQFKKSQMEKLITKAFLIKKTILQLL